jgi:hypothetical protein
VEKTDEQWLAMMKKHAQTSMSWTEFEPLTQHWLPGYHAFLN